MTALSWGVCIPLTLSSEKNYIVKSSFLHRLFLKSYPPIFWLSRDHIDHSHRWSIVDHFLSLWLRLLVGGRLSQTISLNFFEIATSDQGFYFIPELNILFDIVTVITMKQTILLLVSTSWWRSHRRRMSKILLFFDLH